MEIDFFFPPRARIRALPNTRRPRLYLTGSSFRERWHKSTLYPAFRTTAKGYRLFLRLKTGIGLNCAYVSNNRTHWFLKEFVEDIFPDVFSAVVLLGTPGPAQKITIELWDQKGIVGYLKYAEQPIARNRLKREKTILGVIPKELGPMVLKYDKLGDGEAMLLAPILGKPLKAKLPPTSQVCNFFKPFQDSAYLEIEKHPWIAICRERWGEMLNPCLESLSHKKWPVVVHHGDAAPWNLIQTIDGTIRAIDWEYGNYNGFPFIDLVQYILQVSALIYRWPPSRAKEYSIKFLCQNNTAFGEKEAQAIVALTALYAYWQALEDGHSPDAPLQIWRRAIWRYS